MSIFVNSLFSNDMVVAAEGYDPEFGGHFDIMAESSADDLEIIKAMHAYDIAEIEAIKESGTDNVSTPLMEASVKEIWAKIKTFFLNLFKRILGFFKNMGIRVTALVSSNEGFVKKYGNRLDNLKITQPIEKKVFDYNIKINSEITNISKHLDVVDLFISDWKKDPTFNHGDDDKTNAVKIARSTIESKKDNDARLNTLRKDLVGDPSEDNYSNNLFKFFRNGDSEAKDKKITDIKPYKEYLESSKTIKDAVKKLEKDVSTTFNKLNRALSDIEQKAAKSDSKYASEYAAMVRSDAVLYSNMQSIITRFISAWYTAITECMRVSKSICVTALTQKPEKK